jgi:uncharacterized protein
MQLVTPLDCSRIAQDLQIRKVQVESVVQLLDEGNTVPFITRYRKERTGGLNEEVIRLIQSRVGHLRQLAERKQTILKSLEGQGKLTEELRAAILGADTSKRLEDLYLPYKPKKRTLATIARERGLGPLALAIWTQDKAVANLGEVLPTLVNPEKELKTAEDVLLGVKHILAEQVAETADVRAAVRSVLWETGKLCAAKSEKLAEGQGLDYKDYFQFTESVRQIPPHRILALNRGEKEGTLKVRLEWNTEGVNYVSLRETAESALGARESPSSAHPIAVEPISNPSRSTDGLEIRPTGGESPESKTEAVPAGPSISGQESEVKGQNGPGDERRLTSDLRPLTSEMSGELLSPDSMYRTPHGAFLKAVVEDALTRLLLPSLEREIRRELTDESEAHAVNVFARNLRSLLLAPPLRGRRVLAVDPGFRTGCKIAALDEVGNLLEEGVIYPHPPQNKKEEAKVKLAELIVKHQLNVVAIGNGTACRETEEIVSDVIAEFDKRRHGLPPVPNGAVSSHTNASPEAAAAPASGAIVVPEPIISRAIPSSSPSEPASSPTPVALEQAPPTAGTHEPAPAPAAPLVAAPLVMEQSPAAPAPEQASAATPPGGAEPAVPVPAQAAPSPPAAPLAPPPVFPSGMAPPDLAYVIVNEAGASVYSASAIGREEFPDFDATLRGTISIGRRLQDPLSELVKIDPQNIGVGLYQHDVNPRHLKDSLEAIIESCVNQVGVDLNTASVPLLRHVSGLNQLVARELVDYRKQHGPFTSREQLLQVPNVGPGRYVQAAGFLKIPGGDNPLDHTWIHPESYPAAQRLLAELGYAPDVLRDKSRHEELQSKLKSLPPEEVANRLEIGVPTLRDILDALARPGRDPREDLPPPIFKKGILKLEDLTPGMELKGTVLNVVDFGAFVDIGLKDSGLVHISQMANRYIKSPYDVVAVSDVVTVWVLTVDKDRRRVSLSMIKPGTERRPPEKKPPHSRPARAGGSRPPRGRRPPPRQGQGPAQQPAAPQAAPPPAAPAPAAAPPRESAPPPARPAPPPRPALPPRKPRREAPRPKLTQAALEGKTPLRTLGELAAYFAAKQTPAEAEKKPEETPTGETKGEKGEGSPSS